MEALFQAQQRNLKQRRRATKPVPTSPVTLDPALEAAKAAFVDFADAMVTWEDACSSSGDHDDDAWWDRQRATCAEIFARHCTDKPRVYGRPNAIGFQSPSQYDPRHRKIDGVELDRPRRVHVNVIGQHDFRYRYVILKKGGRWLVDSVQMWDGRWTPFGL